MIFILQDRKELRVAAEKGKDSGANSGLPTYRLETEIYRLARRNPKRDALREHSEQSKT